MDKNRKYFIQIHVSILMKKYFLNDVEWRLPYCTKR